MSTLKQFNYLITIVETGSFISASEKLFIAQSALSRQIKNLEQELGFEVFDRTEKKIKLTTAGNVLYCNLKQQINNLSSVIQLAQSVSRGEGRTIKIAHSSSIIINAQKLNVFEQLSESNNIDIEINTLSSELQIGAVLKGDIDLGFIRPPIYHAYDDVNSIVLYTEPLYLALHNTDTSLNKKRKVYINELEDHKFVSIPHAERGGLSYLASNLCLSNGFSPKCSRIRSRKLSQLDLVAQGYGICIVPEEFKSILPKNVKLIPIKDKNNSTEIRLVWKKDKDDLIKKCVDLIVDFYLSK